MAIIHKTLALVQITGQVMLCTHTMRSVSQVYIWLLKDFKVQNNVQQQKHKKWVKINAGLISDFSSLADADDQGVLEVFTNAQEQEC